MAIFNKSILQNIEISDEIIKGHDGFFQGNFCKSNSDPWSQSADLALKSVIANAFLNPLRIVCY